MSDRVERGFALAALAVLVVASGAAVAVPSTSADRVAFDPGVPAEYDFEVPDAGGVARVDGERFGSVQAAVNASEPGDTVVLRGRFDERVVVHTPDITLRSAPGERAVIDGGGEGDVLTIAAPGVTVRGLWVRNSGYDAGSNDAGIRIDGRNVAVIDARVTEITFGIWIDGVDGVAVRNTTIVGRERVTPLSYRGNGIQIWKSSDSLIANNRITDVRDGIYYSWASGVLARGNTMWDLRYGVHYMYSDGCTLRDNVAVGNDVGYALMVSERLRIVDNVAVNNTGRSGHGILVKAVDHSLIRGNDLVANDHGLYAYNAVNDTIAGNLVLENGVGIQHQAGSVRGDLYGNSFINNGDPALVVTSRQLAWNASGRGNYWSSARTSDPDRDGISEIRYRPAGLVEHLVRTHPRAAIFARSPAFDAVRLARSALPVIESPGAVDYHPLAAPPHDRWRRYYARDRGD